MATFASPDIILKPLLAADAPRCVDIYFAAFQNAHSRACWPRDVPAVRVWWEDMIRAEINEPGAHWWKAVVSSSPSSSLAPDDGDGRQEGPGGQREELIIAFAKWVQPKPGVRPDTTLPEWPEGADKELCQRTFGDWAEWHAKVMEDRGHWYLEIIATDPAYQGRGAGTQLLQYGLCLADEQNVEAFLEASPEGLPLYNKMGFREVGRTDTFIQNVRVPDGVIYRNSFMLRAARPS